MEAGGWAHQIDGVARRAVDDAPDLNLTGLHVNHGLQPSVHLEIDARGAGRADAGQQFRCRTELIEDEHRLVPHGPGFAALEGEVGVSGGDIVVVFSLDHERAGHAVFNIDRGRAVLMRVIPVGAGGLAHPQRAGADRLVDGLAGQGEAVWDGADIILRPAVMNVLRVQIPQRLRRIFDLIRLEQVGLPGNPVGRHVRPTRGPWVERVGLQLRGAVGEEFTIGDHGLFGRGGELALVIARQWADLKVHVVRGRVGAGVGAVEMHVGRAGRMQAIRRHIELVRAGAGVARAPLPDGHAGIDVDALIEAAGVHLVDKAELDDVADTRP